MILGNYHTAVDKFRREFLTEALRAYAGNRRRTADAIGLERTYLCRLIRQFEIHVPTKGTNQRREPCASTSTTRN